MLRKAHRSQFSPALEVAGSGLGELRDPDSYASRLKSGERSSVSASTSVDNPTDILGTQVVRGVDLVGLHSGVDKNCEAWNHDRHALVRQR